MAEYLPNGWTLNDGGYYVGGTGTNEQMTLAQYQAIEAARAQAAAMQPIQYDEYGTRISPDTPNYGTPQQIAAVQYAQQQQQPANLGGLLTGPNTSQWAINPAGTATSNSVYSGSPNDYMSQDAQAYFDRYSDLSGAYQANNYGMNPTQWAQAHFNQYGQGEQRTWGVPAAAPTPATYTPAPLITPPPGLQGIRNQVNPTTPSFQTTSPISSGTTMFNANAGLPAQTNNIPQQPTTQPAQAAGVSPYGGMAVDSSAWRAAPTALTDLQRGGRGMLYS